MGRSYLELSQNPRRRSTTERSCRVSMPQRYDEGSMRPEASWPRSLQVDQAQGWAVSLPRRSLVVRPSRRPLRLVILRAASSL